MASGAFQVRSFVSLLSLVLSVGAQNVCSPQQPCYSQISQNWPTPAVLCASVLGSSADTTYVALPPTTTTSWIFSTVSTTVYSTTTTTNYDTFVLTEESDSTVTVPDPDVQTYYADTTTVISVTTTPLQPVQSGEPQTVITELSFVTVSPTTT